MQGSDLTTPLLNNIIGSHYLADKTPSLKCAYDTSTASTILISAFYIPPLLCHNKLIFPDKCTGI